MDALEKQKFTRFKLMAKQQRDEYLHQLEEEMDQLMEEVKSTTKTASSFIAKAPTMLYQLQFGPVAKIPNGTKRVSSALGDLNKELSQAAQKAYTKEKIFYAQLKAYVDTSIEESQEAVHKAMDEASKALNGVVSNIKEGANEVIMSVEDIVKQIQDEANAAVTQVKDGITDAVNQVQDGINDAVNQVKDGVTSVVNQVQDGVNTLVDEATATLEEFKQALKDAINQVLDELDGLWKQLEEALKNGLSLENLELDFSFNPDLDLDLSLLNNDIVSEDELEEVEEETEELEEEDIETFIFDDPLVITATAPEEEPQKDEKKDNKKDEKKNNKKQDKKKEEPKAEEPQTEEESPYEDYVIMSTDEAPFSSIYASTDDYSYTPPTTSSEDPNLKLFNGSKAAANTVIQLLSKLGSLPKLAKGAGAAGLVIDAIGFELEQILTMIDKAGFTGELKPFLRQYLGDIVDTPEFEQFLKAPKNPKDFSEALDRGGEFLDKYSDFFSNNDVSTIAQNSSTIIRDTTAVAGDMMSGGWNSMVKGDEENVNAIIDGVGGYFGAEEGTLNTIKAYADTVIEAPGAAADYIVTNVGDLTGALIDIGTDAINAIID